MIRRSIAGTGMINRGFTLLEILVVIVVLGVVSGIAILSLRGGQEHERLDEAADRLAALVQYQCEEAMLQGRTIGLRLDESGYRFQSPTESGWLPAGDPVLRERRWPLPVTMRLRLDGRAGEEDSILCLPTGEITPFELQLVTANGSLAGVRATPDGRVERFGPAQ